MVKAFVDKELGKVNDKRSSKPEWRKKCADLGYVVAGVAMKLKPAIDLLLPHGLEYSIPYGCLMLIFTVRSLIVNPCGFSGLTNRDQSQGETKKRLCSRP